MKRLAKISALALVAVMGVGMVGCGALKKEDEVPEGKTQLKIYYFNGGYGGEWLEGMKAAYESYNKKAHITLVPFTSKTNPATNIEGGNVEYDLYFLNSTGMNLAAGGYLESLDDVYTATATGDTQTVEQKMLPAYKEYFDMSEVKQVEDSYYAMPWACGYAGLIYNETTLKQIFPSGYTLPRTTEELREFSNDIVGEGAYPFVWSSQVEYWTFMFNVWWAQYEGMQGYEDYFTGVVRDSQGNPSVDVNGENLSDQGRLESLKVLETFMKKSNGYSHQYCDAMDFMKAQNAFFGNGYSNDTKKCVFMINGDWTDSEMALSSAQYNQDIRFMKAPIISALGEKLGITETQLRAVVDYVDGVTTTKPAVSDDAIAAVREARRMVYDLGRHMNIVLPKKAKEKDLAKDFLKFFASDTASEIYVDALNGLNLPYGYEPTNTSKFSGFVQSLYESYPDPLPVSYYKTTSLTFAGNVYTHADVFETQFFGGRKTAQQMLDAGVKKYRATLAQWTEILRKSGLVDANGNPLPLV